VFGNGINSDGYRVNDYVRQRNAVGDLRYIGDTGNAWLNITGDDQHLGLLDATARRNAFGRQLQSFETDLEVEGLGPEPLRAVFIRAPWIERYGPGVEVLASWRDHPVVVRDESVLACAFHPELTDDARIHALFMAMVTEASREREGAR